MNKAQLEFARQELDHIWSRKREAIPRPVILGRQLTPKQFVANIKSGKLKLRTDDYTKGVKNVYPGMAVDRLFPEDKLGVRDQPDDKAYRAKIDELSKEFDTIMRQLMLGDSVAALSLIEAYEKS